MSGTALFLVLLAALLHSIWNILVKSPNDKLAAMAALCFFIFLISALVAFFLPLPETEIWGFILASTLIHSIYKFFLVKAYQKGDFSLCYPIARGLAPLIFLVIAVIINLDKLNFINLLGFLLIIFAVLLIQDSWRKTFIQNNWNLIILTFFVSLCIACYSIIDAQAANLAKNIHSYIVWVFLLDNLLFFSFSLYHRRKFFCFIKQWWQKALLGSFCYISAYWLVVYCFSISNSILVAALRETSIVFGIILATIFLKEKVSLRRIFFSSIIILGVILIKLN